MNAARGVISSVLASMHGDSNSRQAALALAAAGVPVFPVAAESKRPLTRRGFHDASTLLSQVELWWGAHPQANLAIPTGARTGVVVVDIDVHGQVNGYDALARAHDAGLMNGWEFTVRTPSGGLHIYHPAAGASEQRSWQAARAGIDFRGDGGYIIIPPSARTVHDHLIAYTLEQFNTQQPFPLDADQLRVFLDPKPLVHRQNATAGKPIEVERLAAWVARRQKGERNHGVFWAACKMAESDVPAAAALDALTVAGGQAGLTEREVLTTVRSAYRSVHGTHSRSTTPAPAEPDRPPTLRLTNPGTVMTTTPAARRWAVITAVAGAVFIAAGAFWLSFTSLADLAKRSGIGAGQAWAWPLIVDGIIVVATVAVVALAGNRSAWYPWSLLIGGAVVSVTANAIHAVIAADADVPGILAGAVAAVPPVVLLAITHLTVILTRATVVGPVETEARSIAAEPHPALALEAEEPVPPDRRELAAALRGSGWTNKQIAHELGVHPSTIGRWLSADDSTSAAFEKQKTEPAQLARPSQAPPLLPNSPQSAEEQPA